MKDHPIKGIALLTFSVCIAVIMGALSKLLTGDGLLSPIEVVFWQSIVSLGIVVLAVSRFQRLPSFKTTRLKEQISRGIVGNIGIITMYWAYATMPMADVATLLFTGGLMATALSAIFLKERVGIYRWLAVAVGFAGAAIAAAPSGESWQIEGVIAALAAAFFGGGLVSIMLRSLGKTEPATTSAFYTLCCGLVITCPYVIYKGQIPDLDAALLIAGCGVASSSILVTKTQAFRYAEASLLSPVQYTAIIWATLMGWVVWNDLPSLNVVIGAGIIIASNIVILWREHAKSRKDSRTDSDLPV